MKFIKNKNLLVFGLTSFLCLFSSLGFPQISYALDKGILTKCEESPVFKKRLTTSIKKLETRLAKYEKGSLPALALEKQIEQTKNRFDRYSNSNLMCGVDGLPHLITDGDVEHTGEFVLPGILFLYITGWIGWSGRKYIQSVSLTKNPTEKEIIIDVPLALKIMVSGYLWPISSWQEFRSGNFVAKQDDITVSPR